MNSKKEWQNIIKLMQKREKELNEIVKIYQKIPNDI